jgi:Uma2 family endonuclease
MTTTARFPTVAPADWVPGPSQGQWTYADYAAIPDDGKRYEVVKGVLYMSPSAIPPHQDISLEIAAYLRQFVKLTGRGLIFAEMDVELTPGDVLRPDVLVVLKEHYSRIGSSHIIGAPDLVVEILSPSTMSSDFHEKRDAYERAQVPEYWIVSPGERVVQLFVLEKGLYRSFGAFQGDDVLPTRIAPDWSVPVKKFFAFV